MLAVHIAKVVSKKVHASENAHSWNVCLRSICVSASAAVYFLELVGTKVVGVAMW